MVYQMSAKSAHKVDFQTPDFYQNSVVKVKKSTIFDTYERPFQQLLYMSMPNTTPNLNPLSRPPAELEPVKNTRFSIFAVFGEN